jgi:hypothetical protein
LISVPTLSKVFCKSLLIGKIRASCFLWGKEAESREVKVLRHREVDF